MRFISNNNGLHIQMDKDQCHEGGTPVTVHKVTPSEIEWLDNNTPLVVAWLDENQNPKGV